MWTQRLRGRGKRTHGDFHTLDRRCKATWVQSRGVVGEGDAGNVFLKDVLPKAARKGRRRVSQREERVRRPRDTCRGARAFFMMSSGGAERGGGRVWRRQALRHTKEPRSGQWGLQKGLRRGATCPGSVFRAGMVAPGWGGCLEGGGRWREAQGRAVTVVWAGADTGSGPGSGRGTERRGRV